MAPTPAMPCGNGSTSMASSFESTARCAKAIPRTSSPSGHGMTSQHNCGIKESGSASPICHRVHPTPRLTVTSLRRLCPIPASPKRSLSASVLTIAGWSAYERRGRRVTKSCAWFVCSIGRIGTAGGGCSPTSEARKNARAQRLRRIRMSLVGAPSCAPPPTSEARKSAEAPRLRRIRMSLAGTPSCAPLPTSEIRKNARRWSLC